MVNILLFVFIVFFVSLYKYVVLQIWDYTLNNIL
jgi:hypothetical protein